MKLGKILAPIFGVLGLVLMITTTGVCLMSLDAQPRGEVPQEAADCAVAMLNDIAQGDFSAAAERMYGTPDLGVNENLTEEATAVWQIFRTGIRCSIPAGTEQYTVSGTGFAVEAEVSVPQIESITDSLTAHARDLMNQRIAAAEEMADIYDENNDFRQDVIEEVMAQAVALALEEEPEYQTCQTTLRLIREDDRWWVVPDDTLLKALSGGLA